MRNRVFIISMQNNDDPIVTRNK